MARIVDEPGPRREFRIQVLQILDATIGNRRNINWTRTDRFGEFVAPGRIWDDVLNSVAHEYGFIPNSDPKIRLQQVFADWLLQDDQPMSYVLSAIEIAFTIISIAAQEIAGYQDEYRSSMTVEQATADLNNRFKQHDLDYYLDHGSHLIREVNSEFVHAEIVTPALTLVRQEGFQGAESEFSRVLARLWSNLSEEAISDALKAFESTMK